LLLKTDDLQPLSSLTLLVLRIDANYPNHATAVDDFAFVTNLFHARPYFHPYSSLRCHPERAFCAKDLNVKTSLAVNVAILGPRLP
jgi:hypothetical protein